MKKIVSLAILLFMNIACSNAQQKEFSAETLKFNLTRTDNYKISFEEIIKKNKGKKVVLEFWATWCSDCVKNIPNVKKLEANYPDANFVYISFDKTQKDWKEGIKKYNLKGEHYLVGETMKGKFGSSINLDWIPRYIVLNEEGKIVLFRAIETDTEKVEALLK